MRVFCTHGKMILVSMILSALSAVIDSRYSEHGGHRQPLQGWMRLCGFLHPWKNDFGLHNFISSWAVIDSRYSEHGGHRQPLQGQMRLCGLLHPWKNDFAVHDFVSSSAVIDSRYRAGCSYTGFCTHGKMILLPMILPKRVDPFARRAAPA